MNLPCVHVLGVSFICKAKKIKWFDYKILPRHFYRGILNEKLLKSSFPPNLHVYSLMTR